VTPVLAFLLALGLSVTPMQMRIARIVAGEAGVGDSCPRAAKTLIVQMIASGRAPVEYWRGDAEPDMEATEAARCGAEEASVAPTAKYLLSDADVASGALDGQLGAEIATFDCGEIGRLHAFEARRE
jgi:hypothetical protein